MSNSLRKIARNRKTAAGGYVDIEAVADFFANADDDTIFFSENLEIPEDLADEED